MPRLITKGSGASPTLVQRFQEMMDEAGTPEEQKAVAREAVRAGLRFVFDEWGDRNVLGYQEGGIIPEEEEPAMQSQHEPNYMETAGQAPAGTEAEYDQVSATPELREDVSQAAGGGLQFLKRIFGLGGRGDGAVPTPESQQAGRNGAQRMAQGEGAATEEEVDAIDDRIDPERRLSEGDRHMTRLAKTMGYYLEQGRKEDAESVAGSLLMYGANRSSQIGGLAAAAYSKYQQTGNQEDLQNAVKYIEKAYEMVPDASGMDIQIAPDGSGLVVNKVNADGEVEQTPLDPAALPQILRGIQDKSLYWREVTRVADKAGLHQKESQEFQEKTAATEREQELADKGTEREQTLQDAARERGETLSDNQLKRAQELEDAGRTRKEALDDVLKEQQRKIGDELREAKREEREIKLREEEKRKSQAAKDAGGDEATVWGNEFSNLEPVTEEEDPEGFEDYMRKRDYALSRVEDAVGSKNMDDWLKLHAPPEMEDYRYVARDNNPFADTTVTGDVEEEEETETDLPPEIRESYPEATQNSHGVWVYKDPQGKTRRVPGV